MLTVDNYVPGWKPRDLQQAYLPFLEGIGIAQYLSDPVFQAGLEKPPEEDIGAAVGHFLGVFANPNLTWERLEWLRGTTTLPIVLKGILHPEDAREARERGIDGIVVSNHGGRQIDGAIASLDALPPIVDAVGEGMAILLDSGIRSGRGRIQGARARRRRRAGRPALSLGAGARRPERGRDGASLAARGARPDDGAVRRHRARRDRLGAAARDLAGEDLRGGRVDRDRAACPVANLDRVGEHPGQPEPAASDALQRRSELAGERVLDPSP